MAKVPDYKKKLVQDMITLMRQYNIVGVVNMNNLPAPQLQSMRSELRGKIDLFMTKKRLMKIAIGKIKDEKKNIEELVKYFEGMPALIFTNENPFKLSKILQKSKTSAPAKPGQIAPNDIIIRKGPTPFAPGPIISELSDVGLKVGVESGKVAVKEDAVVAKKGDKIKPKVAEILTRLDIKPMQVGLGLVAAYEDGIIYLRDVLEIDEKDFSNKVNLAALQAFNLAFNIAYPIKDNIGLLIAKAFNDAKSIGISQKIFDEGIIEDLLSQAEREMLGLKASANIETQQPKEPRKEEKPEIKKEGQKSEGKKIEAHIQEVVKKEEIAIEEEKRIIEEEERLEEEKPEEAPEEKEVQEDIKEEEEKELEKERIDEEKELEKLEKQIEEIKAEGKKEAQKPKEKKETEEVSFDDDLEKYKEAKAQKEVEELTKELLRKGTLRKK